jgi:hypothetical protein
MTMPVFRELALATPALVLSLFISDVFLGPGENEHIKDPITSVSPRTGIDLLLAERWLAKDSTASRSAWIGADSLPAERLLVKDSITTGEAWMGSSDRRFASEVTPAARVSKAFAQFVPGKSGRAI